MFSASLQLYQSTMATTTELAPGIYRIAVARHSDVEPALLTRHGEGGHVTILPPSAQPDPKQEVIRRFLMASLSVAHQFL
jgi:hypothetical protein